MTKIESNLIKKHLQPKKSNNPSLILKEKGVQINATPNFGLEGGNDNIRLLKAVYSHFAEGKRKAQAKRRQDGSDRSEMTGEELKQAMAEAKSAYEAMREVQEQLNRAYKDLIQDS